MLSAARLVALPVILSESINGPRDLSRSTPKIQTRPQQTVHEEAEDWARPPPSESIYCGGVLLQRS